MHLFHPSRQADLREDQMRPLRAPIAWVFMALLLAVGGCESSLSPAVPSSPGAPSNSPPTVTPIRADFEPTTTTYRVIVSVVNVHPNTADQMDTADLMSIHWSGPDCGNWGPQAEIKERPVDQPETDNKMIWDHPHPPCGPDPRHAEALITVSVTWNWGGGGTIVCVYPGAESGTGAPCRRL